MSTDWQARVLETVDAETDAMVGLLGELVRVPSVGGTDAENDAQDVLGRRLAALGLETDAWQLPLAELAATADFPGVEVERAEAWGLVGRLPGGGDGASLMIDAHIDVVPIAPGEVWTTGDPFGARVCGGTLYGRGACDMKAGLVAGLWAVGALRRSGVPLRGDVLFASVQGEEDGGLGTYGLIQRGWRADACVIPEPTSLDLVPASAGALTFRLRVPGRAAHASRRTAGVSAVDKLWPVLHALAQLERSRNAAPDPLAAYWDLPYAVSIGTVRAGVWASSVPDELVAEGRLGVALDEPVECARAEFEECVAAACAADPWLADHPVTVEWWGGQFGSGRLAADSDLLGRMGAAHARVTGGGGQATWAAPYGSDLRLLTAAGVPTLQYGPGDAGLAHGPDESVSLAEMRTAARALAVLALDVCGVA